MSRSTEQALAIATVRICRETGQEDIALRLAADYIKSPLFEDEAIVPTLTAMLGTPA